MAVVSKEQLVAAAGSVKSALPSSIPLNRDRYSLRIKKCDFGQSKNSGNNMLTLEVEIYYPPTIKSVINGQEYEVAGLDTKMYMSFSEAALPRLLGDAVQKGFMEHIGLKPEIDIENPDTIQFVGKCFSAVCGSEKREQRKELTAAEIAEGKKVGDLILNEDGSTSTSYTWKVLGDITPTKHVPPAAAF